jgi:hypothetical protein
MMPMLCDKVEKVRLYRAALGYMRSAHRGCLTTRAHGSYLALAQPLRTLDEEGSYGKLGGGKTDLEYQLTRANLNAGIPPKAALCSEPPKRAGPTSRLD